MTDPQTLSPENPMLPVKPVESIFMVTSDGVRLDADIYRPDDEESYPVLLMRQAYGRRIACTICYAHPAWYAAHGYVVVVQDIRGRGTSEGEFRVCEDDVKDGAETIEWASRLPGTTGLIGMYGFSYQGYNQLLAASAAGTALRAIAPAMTPWDAREGWSYVNGALRLQSTLNWATQLGAESARRDSEAVAYAELLAAAKALPFYEPVPARPAFIERNRQWTHYHKWVDTPAGDDYWRHISAASLRADIIAKDVPMLFIAGWYDTFLEPTLAAYREISRSQCNAKLVIGPWVHFPWTRKAGSLDFGQAADGGMDELHIRWFDHWLKGTANGIMDESPVRLFDLGLKDWRDYPAWPAEQTQFKLQAGGNAALDQTSGRLTSDTEPVPSAHTEFIVHDPWRPAPSFGGAFGTPVGPWDRSNIDARADVITFTTAAQTAPLPLAGSVMARLCLSSDRPSFDVSCVLSRVSASGSVIPLTDGYRCVTPGEAANALDIPMQGICVTLQPGESLRLSIAGAAFPAYPVNPGTAEDPTRATSVSAQITTIGIEIGAESSLLIGAVQPEKGIPATGTTS